MKVFLSFAYEDLHKVNGFRGMLDNPNAELNVSDGSCKKNYDGLKEQQIRDQISPLLNECGVTVCLISQYTSQSKWVQWELEASQSKSKGILGVRFRGEEHVSLPMFFQTGSYKVINWTDKSTLQAEIMRARR